MRHIKVYRKVHERNKILGLEFPELLLVVIVYLLAFTFSKNIVLNLVIVVSAYLFLRAYKRGKPPHWTSSIIRFFMIGHRYPLSREMNKEIFSESN